MRFRVAFAMLTQHRRPATASESESGSPRVLVAFRMPGQFTKFFRPLFRACWSYTFLKQTSAISSRLHSFSLAFLSFFFLYYLLLFYLCIIAERGICTGKPSHTHTLPSGCKPQFGLQSASTLRIALPKAHEPAPVSNTFIL